MKLHAEHPDVLVVDFYCEQCGRRPGAWWVDGAKVPLPVPEEAEFVRKVSESTVHDGCGGRLVIATEPYTRPAS